MQRFGLSSQAPAWGTTHKIKWPRPSSSSGRVVAASGHCVCVMNHHPQEGPMSLQFALQHKQSPCSAHTGKQHRPLATLAAGHYFTVPGCHKIVPSRQHEFVALTANRSKKTALGVFKTPGGGCWGPVLSFSLCRLGHFLSNGDPRHWPFGVWGFYSKAASMA